MRLALIAAVESLALAGAPSADPIPLVDPTQVDSRNSIGPGSCGPSPLASPPGAVLMVCMPPEQTEAGGFCGLSRCGMAASPLDGYVAPDGRTAAQLIAAHVLPDPAVTPGVLNPAVTPATIKATVCVAGWTATVRPSTGYTDRLRDADTPAGSKPLDGELDHLVSIEDGGNPSDPKNLWWMAYHDRYGARVKDVLETKVKRLVCSGKISLDEARAALAPNWLQGYVKYVGPLP